MENEWLYLSMSENYFHDAVLDFSNHCGYPTLKARWTRPVAGGKGKWEGRGLSDRPFRPEERSTSEGKEKPWEGTLRLTLSTQPASRPEATHSKHTPLPVNVPERVEQSSRLVLCRSRAHGQPPRARGGSEREATVNRPGQWDGKVVGKW